MGVNSWGWGNSGGGGGGWGVDGNRGRRVNSGGVFNL